MKYKHNSFIIQKYIERPLLIHQRKFDIRAWVLINFDFSCYLFREGYLRTSSSEFSIDPNNLDDHYVHLTNNAIQKFADNYGSFEDGNQMSYNSFEAYLAQQGSPVSFKEELVPKMKQLIVRSIFATKSQLDPQRRKSCFEVFGYDFIIDEDFNLWLIEVNTNPCIEESSSLLSTYLPRMVDDMLKLSVDSFFGDFQGQPQVEQAAFPVDGYEDSENMWELLVNARDKASKREAKNLYFTPVGVRSRYAFQISDRQFKVRRYQQEQEGLEAGGPGGGGALMRDLGTAGYV